MAGRPKKPEYELISLEECARAMGNLLIAQTELEKLTAARDQAVAAASADFEKDIMRWQGKAAGIEAALKVYYYGHLGECEKDGRKSIELPTGVMGRRDTPPALKPLNRNWTWAAIKIAVREKWPGKYFHAPKEPEIDKDALKAVDWEELKKVGLKVDGDEVFYAEPARLPDPVKGV